MLLLKLKRATIYEYRKRKLVKQMTESISARPQKELFEKIKETEDKLLRAERTKNNLDIHKYKGALEMLEWFCLKGDNSSKE